MNVLSFLKRGSRKEHPEQPTADHTAEKMVLARRELFERLEENIGFIQETLHHPFDLVVRQLDLPLDGGGSIPAAVLFMDGLADRAMVHEFIIQPILGGTVSSASLDELSNRVLTASNLKVVTEFPTLIASLLYSSTIVLIEGQPAALIIATEGWEHRQVSEPRFEPALRGAQDAFNEVLCVNTALMRRRIKDPNLVIRSLKIGSRSKTDIAVLYLQDMANPKTVEEVLRRLKNIETDAILDSGELEDNLKDSPYSPFPTLAFTERVDRSAAAAYEGRIVILVDGTPFAIIAPVSLIYLMFTPEDYYTNYFSATFIRWIRVLALHMALLLPSIYIAVTTFHQEMVPTEMMIAIAANRTNIPYPSLIEALLMEISLELLREASLRLPTTMGQTIGIVGALVIGQAAVQANLVGPVLTIIVSFTAIGSFAIPSYNTSVTIRLLRFPIMFLAATLGIFGIVFGASVILIHLLKLKSFGVHYLAPFLPNNLNEIDDSLLFRRPSFSLKHQLKYLRSKRKPRQNA
ncbi:spore germination protein [Paenibacillus sp. MBLB4367]|uniref:spore germination protein n=1 Tax=Paenibacillus sp. MBLB4367 TaxID=3384767 RepID=UPI0039080FFD